MVIEIERHASANVDGELLHKRSACAHPGSIEVYEIEVGIWRLQLSPAEMKHLLNQDLVQNDADTTIVVPQRGDADAAVDVIMVREHIVTSLENRDGVVEISRWKFRHPFGELVIQVQSLAHDGDGVTIVPQVRHRGTERAELHCYFCRVAC